MSFASVLSATYFTNFKGCACTATSYPVQMLCQRIPTRIVCRSDGQVKISREQPVWLNQMQPDGYLRVPTNHMQPTDYSVVAEYMLI